MLQLVLYGLLAILLAVGLFLLASRFLPAGEQIAPPLRDEPPWELPGDRMLHPEDVDSVRLPVALRGYRFAETDILLDRLAGELRARDMEIARLRGHTSAPPAPIQFEREPSDHRPAHAAPVDAEAADAEAADAEPDPDHPEAAAEPSEPPPFADEEAPVSGASDDDRR